MSNDDDIDTAVGPKPSSGKPPKHRSPSYPAIDLATAVSRTEQLQRIAGTHPVRSETVIKEAWGYSAKSSNGILSMASLKKYGLVENAGGGRSGEVQITRLGRELLIHPSDSSERLARLRTAALNPTFNAEVWSRYGPNLPADSVILPYLVLDRLFSEAAAKDALTLLRRTIALARLSDAAATIDPDESDSNPSGSGEGEQALTGAAVLEPGLSTPLPPPANLREKPGVARTPRTVQVTYSPTEWALLQGAFPMTEDDWNAMIDMLQAMKRGLVVPGD
jgi:hypothetical protein